MCQNLSNPDQCISVARVSRSEPPSRYTDHTRCPEDFRWQREVCIWRQFRYDADSLG